MKSSFRISKPKIRILIQKSFSGSIQFCLWNILPIGSGYSSNSATSWLNKCFRKRDLKGTLWSFLKNFPKMWSVRIRPQSWSASPKWRNTMQFRYLKLQQNYFSAEGIVCSTYLNFNEGICRYSKKQHLLQIKPQLHNNVPAPFLR